MPTFILSTENPSATRARAVVAESVGVAGGERHVGGHPQRGAAEQHRQADPAAPGGQVVQRDVDGRLGAVVAGDRARRRARHRSARSSGSRPATTAASGPSTQAWAPASDSPVTCHTCGASPQPVTPSLSVTRTTTVSVVVVRRSAVTNGVCSGVVTRVAVTRLDPAHAVHLSQTAALTAALQRVERLSSASARCVHTAST